MYKVCKPLGKAFNREVYIYQGTSYSPTFYLDYKHLVNDLRLHYLYSNHESVLRFTQVTGNDCYGIDTSDTSNVWWASSPVVGQKKEVYILDHDDKKVDIGLLICDIKASEGNGELVLENNKFQLEVMKYQGRIGGIPNYFLKDSLREALQCNSFFSNQRCEFRKDSVPGISNRRDTKELRSIRHFSSLKNASLVDDIISLEEDTEQRIHMKKPSTNEFYRHWGNSAWKDSWHAKSWKTHSRARKQWGKHLKGPHEDFVKWDLLEETDDIDDILESFECG